jgi:membrane associated rhomboid family serine protease
VLRAAATAPPAEAAVRLAFARYVVAEPAAMPWTFVTYGLLHGSWAHVLLNGVWLMAFGTPVARRLGPWRFCALTLAATLAGGIVHALIAPLSAAPLIGASGGVSGLMAAASRFVFQPAPHLPPNTPPWQLPPDRPIQTIPELLRNRTALLFLLVWLGTNLLFGIAAMPFGLSEGAVAWDAHLGGFALGFLALPLLAPRSRRPV